MSEADHPNPDLDPVVEAQSDAEDEREFNMPLPPASFEFLVMSLIAQAQMQMGLMHFGPEEQRPKPNLEMARHSIDLLDVLQEKTKGNLTLEEKRLIENSLTELRFRYVQAAKDHAPQNASQ